MPDLQPLPIRLDERSREVQPQAQFALKARKAYYGLPERGSIIELVAYDVSVNSVFLAGAEFPSPPPLGDRDPSRYIKLHSVDEVDTDAMRDWIEQAGNTVGWHCSGRLAGSISRPVLNVICSTVTHAVAGIRDVCSDIP